MAQFTKKKKKKKERKKKHLSADSVYGQNKAMNAGTHKLSSKINVVRDFLQAASTRSMLFAF